MARSDDLPRQVMLQNGKKIFVKKFAITTTAGATLFNDVSDIEGNPIEAGATLMIQSDVDFWYQSINGSTSVTDLTGARPGTFVPAQSQEFVHTGTLDTKVDVKANTTSGTLVVFHVV